jgi:hypothetical protein
VRWRRYGTAWTDPDGPVNGHLVEFADILDEPFYQLVRQQLLAHALEKDEAHGAQRVRVVHVLPAGNAAYQQSIHQPALSALGDTVSAVWKRLLRTPDRFVPVDSAVFLDPEVTSREYVLRYADDIAHDLEELKSLVGLDDAFDLEDALDAEEEFDGTVIQRDHGIELVLDTRGTCLDYPFAVSELREVAQDLEQELAAMVGRRQDAGLGGAVATPPLGAEGDER